MGVYLDLEHGSMSPDFATPERVSVMTGLSLRQLVYHPKKIKERVAVRV